MHAGHKFEVSLHQSRGYNLEVLSADSFAALPYQSVQIQLNLP
jgi:hypothetical protein